MWRKLEVKLWIIANIIADPLRLITTSDHSKTNINHNSVGIGVIKTEGLICTCQGASCSCIGKNDAHCLWEEDGKCIEAINPSQNSKNVIFSFINNHQTYNFKEFPQILTKEFFFHRYLNDFSKFKLFIKQRL